MATFPLSTNVADGQAGHAGLHNGEREAVNELWGNHGRDTGLRQITALLNGWTISAEGYIRVRRIGKNVIWLIKGLDGTNATDGAVIAALPGFASANQTIIIAQLIDDSIGYAGVITEAGGMWIPPGTRFTNNRPTTVRVISDDTWPNPAPGTNV